MLFVACIVSIAAAQEGRVPSPYRPAFADAVEVSDATNPAGAGNPPSANASPMSGQEPATATGTQGQSSPPARTPTTNASASSPLPGASPVVGGQPGIPSESAADLNAARLRAGVPSNQSMTRQTQLNDQVKEQGLPNAQWQRQGTAADGTPANPEPIEITNVSKTFSSLPNDAGQVWREYDILPYTSQVTNSDAPQQAIIEWILRQTGKEMWFRQPLGILSATREKLIVYHTPEIHNEIHALVDRFVYTRGQKSNAVLNLVTVANPSWRESAYNLLQPIDVHSPGVEAWLVSKEKASLLYNQLSQRSDFKNHSSGMVSLHNGQPLRVEKRAPVQFVRGLRWTPGQMPGYQPLLTQINEGYTLDLSFLDSLDGKSIEVSIACDVDQVERFTTVKVPVMNPTPGGGPALNEKMNLQIPQLVSWRLQERIRWPSDQVLVISCGVVAEPHSSPARPLAGLLEQNKGRADALLFIDFRGPESPRTAQTGTLQGNLAPLPGR